jgi:hypothetical protein
MSLTIDVLPRDGAFTDDLIQAALRALRHGSIGVSAAAIILHGTRTYLRIVPEREAHCQSAISILVGFPLKPMNDS